jgi:hypothetical protein
VICRNRARDLPRGVHSGAAARLDMAPVSLLRWVGRRRLPGYLIARLRSEVNPAEVEPGILLGCRPCSPIGHQRAVAPAATRHGNGD